MIFDKIGPQHTSLFILNRLGLTMYMLIYVDDIIIVSLRPQATNRPIQELTEEFAVKDLRPPNFFLGIEVGSRVYSIDREKYRRLVINRIIRFLSAISKFFRHKFEKMPDYQEYHVGCI
jgi:hypothetical protein